MTQRGNTRNILTPWRKRLRADALRAVSVFVGPANLRASAHAAGRCTYLWSGGTVAVEGYFADRLRWVVSPVGGNSILEVDGAGIVAVGVRGDILDFTGPFNPANGTGGPD